MALDVLRTIVDDVFVASADQVEKALPGNVAGLDDTNLHVIARGRTDRDLRQRSSRPVLIQKFAGGQFWSASLALLIVFQ
jgi:hypothetical protein